ncbi:EAL domain-containing protein [Marinobacterium sp. D7]|uniref:bifunctional diguanylate cyclase/phosphodiesterase n=1 Tax=Marinobacterium ramblicola TaxID=2849041 RepID=UPI001C2D3FAA|nr:EAL domain-containing protein [Marinobacterium ramblicola]MBV1786504.1 EAL domain-containing protein [Marinobacterium ramblicola]
MSLVNQLIAAVLAVLIGLASGTLFIMSDSGKAMLLSQLKSHAQDSATHLGLYIAPFMADKDRAAIETAVNAIFDSGFYQRIEVTSAEGEPLFSKETPSDISEQVPNWFINLVHIEPPSMEREITHNWRHVGVIHVQSRAGYAYERFWEAAQRALGLFVALALLAAIAISLLLHYLLRPLRLVEHQAQSLAQKSYVEQPVLPKTRELRSVVQAMNAMVKQVKQMFDEQSRNIDELRSIAYRDPLTGLANQRFALAQLQERIDYDRNFGPATLVILRIRELSELNRCCGEDNTNHLLKSVASELEALSQQFNRSVVGRTAGAEFMLLLEHHPLVRLKPALEQLLIRLTTHVVALYQAEQPPSPAFTIGISHSTEQGTSAQLLSHARLALQRAEDQGSEIIEYTGTYGVDSSSKTWQQHVASAIGNSQVFLQYQSLIGGDSQPLHGEVLVRILDEDNEPCPAIRFIGVVRELGLLDAMDRAVIGRALAYLQREPQGIAISINLGQDSLLAEDFPTWLGRQLMQLPHPERISFEINETVILNNIERTQALRSQLKALGTGFGVDNFGIHPQGFSYLYTLQPDYLKIDGSLIRDIDKNDEDRFFVRSLIGVAHNIHIRAYAEHVERESQLEQLLNIGIDGTQGYLHGKPKTLS